MAEALNKLGVKTGLIVHSRDGLDEISPSAITDGILIKNGTLEKIEIDPKIFGINGSLQDLAGGDASYNYKILQELLAGESSTVTDTVAINAGALLWIYGDSTSLEAGFKRSKSLISGGQVKKFFDNWIQIAQSIASN